MAALARLVKRSPAVLVFAMMAVVGLVPVALADGTEVSGETDPSQPLVIDPTAAPVVSANVDLASGTRVFFIESMPKSMTIRRVTLGDFARASGCTESPDVALDIYEFASGSDLRSGTELAQSSAPQRLGRALQKVTWLTDATELEQGHSYALAVKRDGGSCGLARQRSWAHNSSQVDGGARACASLHDGSDRLRLWHEQGEDDASACATLGTLLGFDPPMPSGWMEIKRDGGGDAVNASTGECASDLGAVETTHGSGIVCQFPTYAAAGDTITDGWYYGLPWKGPGLDGSPRDIYLSLEPDTEPVVETGDATDVTSDAATAHAEVTANGSPTTTRFELGTDTSYGQLSPSTGEDAGEEYSPVAVSHRFSGLEPGTTYHFRARASHGGEAALGEDHTFTTATAPASATPPSVSGSAVDGENLRAGVGSWTGTKPIAWTYQWQHCDSAGENCADIAHADGQFYRLEPEDIDHRVRVVVTAENAGGSDSASSAATAVVKAIPPTNTMAPSLTGEATSGRTLTASTGLWSGASPFAYSHQWQACNSEGGACEDIEGATEATLTLAAEQVGKRVRIDVTAANAGGSASEASGPTEVVAAPAVTNTSAPSITRQGSPDGDVLVAESGAWEGEGPISYGYRWRNCNADGNECFTVPGATGASYALSASDIGSRLRVVVIATSDQGSASATSAPTAIVDGQAPTNETLPSLRGTVAVDGHVQADPGQWTGIGPLDYSYQWRTCDEEGDDCTDISGADADSHPFSSSDVGTTVRVVVRAENAEGSATATSAASAPIVPESTLMNLSPPAISGSAADGEQLSATTGTWTGQGTVDYAYQWQRCDATGSDCSDIDNATTSTHDLDLADVGTRIAVILTATDDVTSVDVRQITARSVAGVGFPVGDTTPAITGTAREGDELSASEGTWSGPGPQSHAYQWQGCDADGSDCEEIEGASDAAYSLTADDVGATLRVAVTASNTSGTTSAVSGPSSPVSPGAPLGTTPPEINGDPRQGTSLTANSGGWDSPDTLSYGYQWQRCDGSGADCADISGETASSYLATSPDATNTLRAVVTATNSRGSTVAASGTTYPVAPSSAPQSTTAPTISGPDGDGLAESTDGLWSSSGTASFAYQWERCDTDGRDCTPIEDATGASYTATEDDLGSSLRLAVTATDTGGSATAQSAASAEVTPETIAAPVVDELVNSSPPSIAGVPRQGEQLSAAHGLWTASSGITYSYKWHRCTTTGHSCADIASATQSTHDLDAGDIGATLRVTVTASTESDRTTMISDPTATITAAPPVNQTPPGLSGTTTDGEVLSALPGAWTWNPDQYDYQWQRCNAAGSECGDIQDATDPVLLLGHEDVGGTVRVTIMASNAGAQTVANSAPSAVVAAAAPVALGIPALSADPVRGVELSASSGSWDGTPTFAFAYQWQRCDEAGENCADIVGAEGPDYTPTATDVDNTLRIAVTATNDAGSATSHSAASGPVASGEPSNEALPSITGYPMRGYELTADPGSWSGTPTLSYSYQWRRCDGDGENCADIPGATESGYTATGTDASLTLRVAVTASNDAGSQTAITDATAPVADGTPINGGGPWINGDAVSGGEMTADPGYWEGTPTLGYGYQWQRCDGAGENCDDIVGAASASFTPSEEYLDDTLRVTVVATNAIGETTQTSDPTAAVALAEPVAMYLPPSISGHANLGQTLTADPGGWNGYPSFTYQWQRCDEAEQDCADIPDATSTAYTAVTADLAATLRVMVHAIGPGGSDSARSDATPIVTTSSPVNEEAPGVSGNYWTGQSVSAEPGSWSGTAPISYSYQWQRCNGAGSDCNSIIDATAATYATSQGEAGAALRVIVTAANGLGASSATSGPTPPIGADAPESASAPTLSGAAELYATMTVSDGAWTVEPSSYEYQWQRCDASGENCADVDYATGSSYWVHEGDQGRTLVAVVTARYADGASAVARTAPSEVAFYASGYPHTFESPTFEGRLELGHTLQANHGLWNGLRPMTYGYQWSRCTSATSCSYISGATGQSYKLTGADTGNRIALTVKAENSLGTTWALSAVSSVVGAPALASNMALPQITGATTVGEWLESSPGEWEGAISGFDYRWQRCNTVGGDCAELPTTYTNRHQLTRADLGHTLRSSVTAHPAASGDSLTATSLPSSVIAAPQRPTNTTSPTIMGTAEVGEHLYADTGAWVGTPQISYGFQWNRCDEEGLGCEEVEGSTGSSYRLGRNDLGHTIAVTITASNGGGSTATSSEPTDVVPEPPPLANVLPPSINNWVWLAYGHKVYAFDGTWTGEPTLSQQFQRCDPLTEDPQTGEMSCEDIPGATDLDDFEPGATEIGFRLRVKETATTPTENEALFSPITSQEVDPSMSNQTPTYTGTVMTGETITAASGVTPPPGLPRTTSYRFTRQNEGEAETELQDGTDPTYTLTDTDVDHHIRIEVTDLVQRADGQTVVKTLTSSAWTPVVDSLLTNDTPPSIDGTTRAGSTLTASPGTWHGGGGPLDYTYQWRRCDESGSACADIADADQAEYRLTVGDIDSTVRIKVTADANGANESATSAATTVIEAANPVNNTVAPSISGEPAEGEALTADPGTWTGDAPIEYTFQWEACEETAGPCEEIDEATTPTYESLRDYVGWSLRVRVQAINGGGDAVAYSTRTAPVEAAPNPVSERRPSLTMLGRSVAGAIATTDGGEWANAEVPDLTRQWRRCDSQGENCEDVGEGFEHYYLTAADVGSRVQVEVTADNASGTVRSVSELSPVISSSQTSAADRIVYLNQSRTSLHTADQDGADATSPANCTSIAIRVQLSGCHLHRPRISPNGQMIIVEVREAPNATSGTMVLMNYDGTDIRALPQEGSHPTWGLDGREILYTGRQPDGSSEIVIGMAGDSAEDPVPLVTSLDRADSGEYAPDGSRITYVGQDSDGTRDLYVAGHDGTEARRLPLGNAIGDVFHPTFSADGSEILFTAESTQDSHGTHAKGIYAIQLDGSRLRKLSDGEDYGPVSPSPDGGTILTSRRTVTITNYGGAISIDYGAPRGWVMQPDGSDGHDLFPTGAQVDMSSGPGRRRGDPPSLPSMTPEMKWCVPFWRWKRCAHAARARSLANRWEGEYIADHELTGIPSGTGDAFRHCAVSGMMTAYMGRKEAKGFGDRHEQSVRDTPNAHKMDYYNNKVGRDIGARYRSRHNRKLKIKRACLRGTWLRNGSLWVLER